ncbi:MAG: DUF4405 domain-containing protein [Betaproteobacteria bacterium]|jgi:hypothetical protein|nr:DUF4405 domain-containing protein [Betaproteobacteria bacterium]MBK7655785.1 DUF4405 domain-containing protein [Betaproteobacteria bacterium]MBP6646843.1 DUF4405 domain-containing protein [Burkholderiaceae bacterium]
MNLNPHRSWITPLVIGSFALSGVTGVLMFFHLDTGLNKAAHEWLSWALLIGVGLHAVLNLFAFKRYFSQPKGLAVMGLCALLLALSFVSVGSGKSAPPFARPIKSLAAAPLSVLATVAGVDTAEVKLRLKAANIAASADDQNLAMLVGADLKAQIKALNAVLAPAGSDSR